MRAHKNKLDFCSNKIHSIVCRVFIVTALLNQYYCTFYFIFTQYLNSKLYIFFKPETIEYTSNCVPKCNSLTNQNEHEPFCHFFHLKGVFPPLSFFGPSTIWKLCHILTIAREMGTIFAIEAISSY